MTSPKMSYEINEKDSFSVARSKDAMIYVKATKMEPPESARYLQGYENGSDFGANYQKERAAKLVEALNKIKNGEIRYYEQWNGNDKIPDQFEFIDKVLAEYEGAE